MSSQPGSAKTHALEHLPIAIGKPVLKIWLVCYILLYMSTNLHQCGNLGRVSLSYNVKHLYKLLTEVKAWLLTWTLKFPIFQRF